MMMVREKILDRQVNQLIKVTVNTEDQLKTHSLVRGKMCDRYFTARNKTQLEYNEFRFYPLFMSYS
ncbi:MAG: hypothetical protein N5P05_000776 [Chroococcopsis gigantea SAG 12.99]|jgi:hypothetical protein|nr:hypothetical protein [Chroococcopsis gigantea SAG 12.99]